MNRKTRFRFRIPTEVRALPSAPTPASIQHLSGLYIHVCPGSTHLPENSCLVVLLVSKGTYPAVEFVSHRRVDSGERLRKAQVLGGKLQDLRHGVEFGAWALEWVQ